MFVYLSWNLQWSSVGPHMGHQNFDLVVNCQLFLQSDGLFRISREFAIHGLWCMVSCVQFLHIKEREEHLYRGKKRNLENIVKIESLWLFIGWVFAGKEVFLLTLGIPIFSVMRALPSYLPTLFNWCFILVILFLIFASCLFEMSIFFPNCHSVLSFPSCLDVHFIELFLLFMNFGYDGFHVVHGLLCSHGILVLLEIKPMSPALPRQVLNQWTIRKPLDVCLKVFLSWTSPTCLVPHVLPYWLLSQLVGPQSGKGIKLGGKIRRQSSLCVPTQTSCPILLLLFNITLEF